MKVGHLILDNMDQYMYRQAKYKCNKYKSSNIKGKLVGLSNLQKNLVSMHGKELFRFRTSFR